MDVWKLSLLALVALVPVALYAEGKGDLFAWLAAINVALVVAMLVLMFRGGGAGEPTSES